MGNSGETTTNRRKTAMELGMVSIPPIREAGHPRRSKRRRCKGRLVTKGSGVRKKIDRKKRVRHFLCQLLHN